MASNPDKHHYFYNRHTRKLEVESIYGEEWLRWSYGTFEGRLTMWAFGKRAWVSMLYGLLMRLPESKKKIKPFISKYGVDVKEMAASPDSFNCFNDFFIRRLKPEARPITPDANTAVFPADGRHRGYASSTEVPELLIKGERYSLDQLCAWPSVAKKYHGGAVVISRLCPVDYHRYHFPVAGLAGPSAQITGVRDSVSPIALKRCPSILYRNKRHRCEIDTSAFGKVCMIEIGAACVASIKQTYQLNHPVEKGAEKGYFAFGGSCIALLFEPGRIHLAPDLLKHTQNGHELYAHMGTPLGTTSASS